MRVPSYQNQIAYQPVRAQQVELAKPISNSYHSAWWEGLTAAGSVLRASGATIQAIQAWLKSREEEKKKAAGQGKVGPASPEQTPDIPGDGPREASARKAGEISAQQYNGFSNQSRRALLAYSREQAFTADQSKQAGVTTPVQKLDEYAEQQLITQAQTNQAADLWLQDYALIRQEVEQVQHQTQQQQFQETFQQGAQSFLQTAALVRDPEQLEKYIHSNLQAAEEELQMRGGSKQAWAQQKEQLYAQAVRHNIQSALQAQDMAQAQAMYKKFTDHFSAAEREVLSEKLSLLQAQNDEGKQNYEGKATDRYAAQKQHWQLQADSYGKLAQAFSGTQPGLESVLGFPAQSAAELATVEHLFNEGQRHPQRSSDASVFNDLYRQIQDGTALPEKIDQAFEKKRLSAADACRLKQAFCLAQTQAADPREELLLQVVRQMCKGYDFDEFHMEQATYTVLSAGPTLKERVQAAKELKQFLALQEKTK